MVAPQTADPHALLEQLKPRFNLAYGFPSYGVSRSLIDRACLAASNGENNYSPATGSPALCELIRSVSAGQMATAPAPMICAGASAGIACTLFSLFQDGGELIAVDPYFAQHHALAVMSGARVTYVSAYPSFRLPVRKIIEAMSKDTRAILLCTPNNPTGAVYTAEELNVVHQAARERGIYIIVDEIYREFTYSEPRVAAHSLLGLYDKAVIVRGISKNTGAAGWRIGYVFADEELSGRISFYHKMLYTCAPTPFQSAIREEDLAPTQEILEEMAGNASFIYRALSPHYELNVPEGGYFVFPKAPRGMTGMDVFVLALERGLGLLPSRLFSGRDDHFRLTFAAARETLEMASAILVDIALDGQRTAPVSLMHELSA